MVSRLWKVCGGAQLPTGGSSEVGNSLLRREVLDETYDKELRLLQFVFQNATPGCSESVRQAIQDFATEHLVPEGGWLKVAGGTKAVALTRWAQQAPSAGYVLEVGTYIGFSAMQLVSALPGVKIISLEVDPVHAIIARTLVAFTGLAHAVDILIGHSEDLLPQLHKRYKACENGKESPMFRAVFFDQRGSRYDRDLRRLENLGLLLPGCIIIADNVLKPGSPLFLWRLLRGGDYHARVVSMPEFAMPDVEDWMAVGELVSSGEAGESDFVQAPAVLFSLEREAESIRSRANRPGAISVRFTEWATFGAAMKAGLQQVGITADPLE